MRKFIAGLLIFLLIAAGIGYLLYPTASDQLCRLRDGETMKTYRVKAAAMDSEKKAELFDGAKAYNDELEAIRVGDVFTDRKDQTNRDYQNRLNVHSGVIGELVISKIGLSLPVYHRSSETPVNRYLVHIDGSCLPTGEGLGNIVLAGPGTLQAEGVLGQIGLTDSRMLEDLDGLVHGDLLILNVLDRTLVYRVSENKTLSAAELNELDLTPERTEAETEDETEPENPDEEGEAEEASAESKSTLRGGWTEGQLTVISRRGDRRLLIRSELISIQEARTLFEEEDKATFPESWKNVLLLGCPVLLAGLLILWIIELIKRRHYILPDEGKQSDRRRKKAMEKLNSIPTETKEEKEP